jgi:hypothetical protein
MTVEAADKASCHSDFVDAEIAKDLQEKRSDLVELNIP